MNAAGASSELQGSSTDAGARGNVGTTLKLRLSLLITALLATATLAGGIYVVGKARDDITAETRSTLDLTSHFLDAQIEDLHDGWAAHGYSTPTFHLRDLGDIRHLNVTFYDDRGRPLEADAGADRQSVAPQWFAFLVRVSSRPLPSRTRAVIYNGATVGRLVIAPDASYETDEIWATCRGLLELLLSFFVLVNVLVWWAASRAMRPVERILQALDELRGGNLSARLPSFGLPELSRISVGFNHMAETLERSVTENQRLTRQLLQTQENERASIARELHDEIGQCVSAIHADAAAIRNRGGESVRESAQAIVEVTGHLQHIVRSMLQRLRPPLLETLGLAAALRELIAGFRQRNQHVVCTLRCSGELEQLDSAVSIAVYRVIQECLTNIAVHANASSAAIEVALSDRHVRATVTDDGVGFFLLSVNQGLGLTGIKERVTALGGTCDIHTQVGRGTFIGVRVPLPAAPGEPR